MLICHFLFWWYIINKIIPTLIWQILLTTTWWQQQRLLPALPPLNFTPGSGSSFLSCFCFRKRHTEVRSCQYFIRNKSSLQVGIRLIYPSLLNYCCVFVFLHLISCPRVTRDIWLETILPVCRCASRLAAAWMTPFYLSLVFHITE